MNIPENLKYSADHEWVSVSGDVATIGVTDFAQGELGDIVYVEVEEGAYEKGDAIGSIEAVKTVSEIFIPVAGEVTEINEALEDQPDLVNSDPYGAGWIVKVTITDQAELEELMDGDAYKNLISN